MIFQAEVQIVGKFPVTVIPFAVLIPHIVGNTSQINVRNLFRCTRTIPVDDTVTKLCGFDKRAHNTDTFLIGRTRSYHLILLDLFPAFRNQVIDRAVGRHG